MHTLLLILGIIGFTAVLTRGARTVFHLLHGGVESVVAGEVASARARRGDVTGLQDALDRKGAARRRRRAAVGGISLWGGMLLLPPLTPWPATLYAAYSVLWLLPHRRPAGA
jgi:hypothetical protein